MRPSSLKFFLVEASCFWFYDTFPNEKKDFIGVLDLNNQCMWMRYIQFSSWCEYAAFIKIIFKNIIYLLILRHVYVYLCKYAIIIEIFFCITYAFYNICQV